MLIEVKVPVLSESIADATLVTWHKKVGEFVRRDESLVDLETDKVVLEVVAPNDGVLKTINKPEDTLVMSDELIATIDSEGKASADSAASNNLSSATVSLSKSQNETESADTVLSPAARKLAAENNIDPARVSGTGKDHRVTKADVVHYLEARTDGKGSASNDAENKAVTTSELQQQMSMNVAVGSRIEKRVPMSRLRARVAERLKDAQNTAAILTTFNEVNMDPIMSL